MWPSATTFLYAVTWLTWRLQPLAIYRQQCFQNISPCGRNTLECTNPIGYVTISKMESFSWVLHRQTVGAIPWTPYLRSGVSDPYQAPFSSAESKLGWYGESLLPPLASSPLPFFPPLPFPSILSPPLSSLHSYPLPFPCLFPVPFLHSPLRLEVGPLHSS